MDYADVDNNNHPIFGFYSVNMKQSSIMLHTADNYITLSQIDLRRLKQ